MTPDLSSPTRSDREQLREWRRKRMAELIAQGLPMHVIAERLGLTISGLSTMRHGRRRGK